MGGGFSAGPPVPVGSWYPGGPPLGDVGPAVCRVRMASRMVSAASTIWRSRLRYSGVGGEDEVAELVVLGVVHGKANGIAQDRGPFVGRVVVEQGVEDPLVLAYQQVVLVLAVEPV